MDNYFVYFPQSKRLKPLPFEVTGGGLHRHPPHKPYPDQGHPQSRMFQFESGRSIDSFQILWISKGKGVYRDPNHPSTVIHAGESFLLFPGHWHSYQPHPEVGWDEHWFEFQGELPNSWLKKKYIQTQQPIRQNRSDPLIELLFQELHRLNHSSIPYIQELRNSLALHLAQRILFQTSNQESIPDSTSVQLYRSLQEKLGQQEPEPSLEKWCLQHGASYHTFRLWFQKENKISPKQYLSQIRIRKAKEWLLGSSLQIQQIADKIGYANAFHFSNHFKNETGFTPKEFRKSKRSSIHWK